tara:strand:- start:584 stop:742 length:159 start_codon:yes stop_codon:yes gene_type:complete
LYDSQAAIGKLAQLLGWNAPAQMEVSNLGKFLNSFPTEIPLPSGQKSIGDDY